MTLEYSLCKKLSDAGFPQKGSFWWIEDTTKNSVFLHYRLDEAYVSLANSLFDGPFEFSEWEEKHYKLVCQPTLSELIDACGEEFMMLQKAHHYLNKEVFWRASGWVKQDHSHEMPDPMTAWDCNCPKTQDKGEGKTPEEAVTRLWLAIQDKQSN